MLSTVSIDVVVLTSAWSPPCSGIGMSRMSFIPLEFTVVAATIALLSTSFIPPAAAATKSLDMLFSLTTPPPSGPAAEPPSFFSRISLSVLSRLCLSLISSAKKLVSVIFSLMSNFFAAPVRPDGDRDRLPLE